MPYVTAAWAQIVGLHCAMALQRGAAACHMACLAILTLCLLHKPLEEGLQALLYAEAVLLGLAGCWRHSSFVYMQ